MNSNKTGTVMTTFLVHRKASTLTCSSPEDHIRTNRYELKNLAMKREWGSALSST